VKLQGEVYQFQILDCRLQIADLSQNAAWMVWLDFAHNLSGNLQSAICNLKFRLAGYQVMIPTGKMAGREAACSKNEDTTWH
jgi:hypothetical protein